MRADKTPKMDPQTEFPRFFKMFQNSSKVARNHHFSTFETQPYLRRIEKESQKVQTKLKKLKKHSKVDQKFTVPSQNKNRFCFKPRFAKRIGH